MKAPFAGQQFKPFSIIVENGCFCAKAFMAEHPVIVLEIPGVAIQFANLLSAMAAWAEEAEMPADVKIVYDAACKFADDALAVDESDPT